MREPKIYPMANGYGFRLDIGVDPKTGKRKQKRFGPFRTKSETRRVRAEKMHELTSGNFVNPTDMKIREFLLKWLDHKNKNVSKGTMDHYKPYIMNHLIPNLGSLKLDQLRPVHIQELYNHYVEEELLSNQSIVHMHRALNNAYKLAMEWELITKNPCEVIKPPKPEKHEMIVWDETEVQFFLDLCRSDRFYVIYLNALSTGMRKGELLGLKWQDIDFTNHYLSVQRAVTKKKGGGHEIGKLKNEHSYRNISLFDFVIEELKQHKHEQMKFKMKNRVTYKDQDLVMGTSTGNFILPRNLDRSFYPLLKKSVLKRIRFHDMRHTHAALLLKQGVHPKVVQERLGHSSISVTLDTYSHVLPNIQKEAAANFGTQIFGSKNTNKQTL